MTSQEQTVRQYLGDLIAVIDHVAKAMSGQERAASLAIVPGAAALIEQAQSVLTRHRVALEARVNTISGGGGVTVGGAIKDAVTAVTGSLAALYGKARGEAASRILRDDYTAMSFVTACATMLHTTAVAVDDAATAELTSSQIKEYPALIMAMSDLLPHAVVADLEKDKVVVTNSNAGDRASRDVSAAWHAASQPSLA